MPPQVGIGHPQKIEAAHDSCKSTNDSSLAKEGQSPKSHHLTLGHYVTHRAPPPDLIGVGCAPRTIDRGQKTVCKRTLQPGCPPEPVLSPAERRACRHSRERGNPDQCSVG